MIVLRRPRILAAVALASLIALFTFHNRDVLDDIRTRYSSPSTKPTSSQKAWRPDPEAHKLPWADSFLAHFGAVTSLEGITLAEAKKTCHWPEGLYVNFQYGPDTEWVVTERSDDEIASRRKRWQHYVMGQMIPWERVKHKFRGRGIVVTAGNHDTVMRLKMVLRQLKKLHCKLPVEIHYWDDEMTEATMNELANLYQPMSFNDLAGTHNIIHAKKDKYINYQLKSASLVNSRFAEPLLLDSDNIPVLDPSTIYDSHVYQEYRTVFWPDIARSWPQNPAWAITNTPCRMGEYEQESGQLMVDKRRYWYHLQLAAWLNNEQGQYYNQFLLGDKDMFRFAWHALKTDYGRPRKWLTSVGTLNDDVYCGHTFAQHHPDDGRVAFMHGGLTKQISLEMMRWNREEKGAYFRHYKRAPSDENPSISVHVDIIFDGASYKASHEEGFHAATCTEMKDVKVGELDEILPGWEKEYEELGGYWMLEQGAGKKAKGGQSN